MQSLCRVPVRQLVDIIYNIIYYNSLQDGRNESICDDASFIYVCVCVCVCVLPLYELRRLSKC